MQVFMAKMHVMRLSHFLLIPAVILIGCKKEQFIRNEVRIAIKSDIANINPLMINSASAREVVLKVNEQIEIVNPFTLKIEPSVGELIDLKDSGDGHCLFSFRVRTEAHWNSGIPITVEDILLTLKLNKLPDVANNNIRASRSDIFSAFPDSLDQRIISINVEGNCVNQRSSFVDLYVLPKHVYDPYGILEDVSIQEINESPDGLSADSRISNYVKYFNSEEFGNRLKNHSAKYGITRIETGQFIELTKQPDWWGYNLDDQFLTSISNLDKIIYYTITENTVALIALNNGEIDVVENVAPLEFNHLDTNDFTLLEPLQYRFGFLAFNSRLKKFNKPLREAMAIIFPYQEIIDVALQGYGVKTIGPILPKDSVYYNFDLESENLNPDKATKILLAEGLKKSGNRWVDKEGNPLSFKLSYPLGKAIEQSASLVIKQTLEDFGISIELDGVENSLLGSRLKAHDFEMALRGFVGGPFAHNFAPIFGLEASAIGGLNYSGFGNQQSDSVINAINIAQSIEDKRTGILKLQELLHEERTMLFLYFEKNRIAVSKRFKNVRESIVYPGYYVNDFELFEAN